MALISPVNMTANNVPAPYVASCHNLRNGAEFQAYYMFSNRADVFLGFYADPADHGYVQLDFGSAKTVRSYSIQVLVSSIFSNNDCPKAWEIWASNDNFATHTVIDTVSAQTVWSLGQIKFYTCASPGSYTSYRWVPTDSNGSSAFGVPTVKISQIQFLDDSPSSYGDLDRSAWTLSTLQDDGTNHINNIKDGDKDTYWAGPANPRNVINIDFGANKTLNYIRIYQENIIKNKWELYYSDDASNYTAVTWAEFNNVFLYQVLTFPQITKRYIRLVMLPNIGQVGTVGINELNAGFQYTPNWGTLSLWTQDQQVNSGQNLNYQILAKQGTGNYSFSTTSTLPTGLTLGGTGLLAGTTTQQGTFNITIHLNDGEKDDDNNSFDVVKTLKLIIGNDNNDITDATPVSLTVGAVYGFSWSDFGGLPQIYYGDATHTPGGVLGGNAATIGPADNTPQAKTVLELAGDPLTAYGMSFTGNVGDASQAVIWATVLGTTPGSATGDDQLFIFGVYLRLTYDNGVQLYSFPTVATIQFSGIDGVLDKDNAVDLSLDTYANVFRNFFSNLSTPAYLRLTGFDAFRAITAPVQMTGNYLG